MTSFQTRSRLRWGGAWVGTLMVTISQNSQQVCPNCPVKASFLRTLITSHLLKVPQCLLPNTTIFGTNPPIILDPYETLKPPKPQQFLSGKTQFQPIKHLPTLLTFQQDWLKTQLLSGKIFQTLITGLLEDSKGISVFISDPRVCPSSSDAGTSEDLPQPLSSPEGAFLCETDLQVSISKAS